MTSSKAPVLQIEAGRYGQSEGWRLGAEVIDALPYADHITESERRTAEQLIQLECSNSTKSVGEYLAEFPGIQTDRLEARPLLSKELARVAEGDLLPSIDKTRLQLPPPFTQHRGDPESWLTALNNARAQLEHQHTRIVNLELGQKFGPNTLRAVNESAARTKARLEAEVKEAREKVDGVNRARKLLHLEAQKYLGGLEAQWVEVTTMCGDIEVANIEICGLLKAKRKRVDEQQRETGMVGERDARGIMQIGVGVANGVERGEEAVAVAVSSQGNGEQSINLG